MNFDPKTIKAGDWLVPILIFNTIALNNADTLPNPVQVIAVEDDEIDGILFKVKTTGGNIWQVNNEWFNDKAEPPK